MNVEKGRISEFATASLVLGIVQFVHIFNAEKAILAIVFGLIAIKRISENQELGGRKQAVAGIILGVVGIVATIVMTIIFWPRIQAFMEHAKSFASQKK